MSIHTTTVKPGVYFITFTCHNWLSLIELANAYDTVYNFFGVLVNQCHSILAYVIMPNHLHFIMHYNSSIKLNTVIGNGKRFMAYEIIERLEQKNELQILEILKEAVRDKDRARGKQHEVWIQSFDVKECRTEKFLIQKLHYIHLNPLSGKWKLCETAIDYLHSSALFYHNGKQRLFEVKDYRNFLDWDHMYEE